MKIAPAAQPYLEALAAHHPFSEMSAGELGALLGNATVTYHSVGETLLEAGKVARECWIVLQGRVRGERPADATVGALELTAGEMFPIGALLTERAVVSRFFCEAEVFALRIPADDFLRSARQSSVLADFCARRLTFLLERSRRALQESYAAEGGREQQIPRSLQSLIRRDAVSTQAQQPIRAALQLMQQHAVGSLVIVDAANRPMGIVTERDIVPRVVLAGRSPDDAIDTIATKPVTTLPMHASAVEAALLMAERGFRHVVVVDGDGALAGIVSERDLFALQRHTLTGVSGSINRANSAAQLAICAADARQLARNLIAQGVEALTMTRFVSRLNDQLVRRMIDLLAPDFGVAANELCWIALGSEGRHEQTISTDQDNALILAPGVSQVRALNLAKAVNDALDQCGFPLCKGNIMASNPELALSSAEWRSRFAEWIDRGAPESLLQANIFFDLRALWGDVAMAADLQAQVLETASGNQRFLKQLCDNALSVEPPLNWLGNLSATAEIHGRQVIDLKRFGVRPFVDAARVLALAHRVDVTNTIERLQAVAAIGKVQASELSEWKDAFGFLQSVRLRAQERNEFPEIPNAVAIDSLSPMDARILKECFRQARKLQQRVAADYP